MGLQNLATELTQQILHELGDHSQASQVLCSLRSTCRHLNAIAEAQLFSNITVSVSLDRAHCSATQLEALALGRASTYAKSLEIRSLNSTMSYKAHITGIVVDENSALAAIERIRKCLPHAIKSLVNVRTVSWRILNEDHEWALSNVAMALPFLPSLADFRLDCADSPPGFIVPLHHLSDLRRITLKGGCEGFKTTVVHPLSQAISHSPNLSFLDTDSRMHFGAAPSLHDLLGCSKFTGTRTCLPLKHLSLRYWNVSLDEVTMPHLKSLTSLILISQGYDSMNSRHVWSALLAEHIRLIELTADEVPDELLEYIASYSGLQKLRLHHFEMQTFTTVSSDKFFRSGLPAHSNTLQSLALVPAYEGNWCFSEINAAVILGCQRLKELSIMLRWEDYEPDTNQKNPVDFLLNSTCELPELRHLQIDVAIAHNLRGGRCGNPMMAYTMCVRDLITTSMLASSPLDPDKHLSEVTGSTQVFRISRDPNRGGELRYIIHSDEIGEREICT